MRNRSVTQVLPSAAGQSVDVKQMLVEGNLDGVSGQKCSGARQTVMKQESPVIIFDLTAGVSTTGNFLILTPRTGEQLIKLPLIIVIHRANRIGNTDIRAIAGRLERHHDSRLHSPHLNPLR